MRALFGDGIMDLRYYWLRRVDLDAEGRIQRHDETCGIFIVEGLHRAAVADFVRDPKSGGCSVGVPPANLGFRLVREVAG